MSSFRSVVLTDPGWEHGVSLDARKKKVKCNYCGKILSGGVYRLKQHLARISGEVTYCKKAPEEVYVTMKENLSQSRAVKKRELVDEEQSFHMHAYDEDEHSEEPNEYNWKVRQVSCNRSLVVDVDSARSPGHVDPGWEHGVALDEKKKKVKCNYCQKVVSGGINRFKQHLARIPGEVAYCKMAPEEVYLKMKENMKHHRNAGKQRPELKQIASFYTQSENKGKEQAVGGRRHLMNSFDDKKNFSSKPIRKRQRGTAPDRGDGDLELQLKHINFDSSLAMAQRCHAPLSLKLARKSASDKKCRKEVISSICKFFCYAAVPFSAANSSYFHKMLELVGQYGQGLKGPLEGLISGHHLQEEAAVIKENLIEAKASWAVTGCTVLADSWKNAQGHMIINFLVSCPRDLYFLYSVDISDILEDGTGIFNLLDKVVDEVGEENIVQVVTQNSPSYKVAGKMLEEKRKSLYWTPCAAYCLDQMLEEFAMTECASVCIEKSQKLTRLVYNHAWLLSLMKKEHTAGKELLRPAPTQSVTSFLTLQSLLYHRTSLKSMFQSSKWISSQLAKTEEGKEVAKLAMDAAFWKKVDNIIKSVNPVLEIFKKNNHANGLSVPFIYNDVYRAKLAIKASCDDDRSEQHAFLNVLESYWGSYFHHPLYLAAYFLNPSFRYRSDFTAQPEVIRGLNDCITRLEADNRRRVSATSQISDFVFAKGDFGTELALGTRTEIDPAAWWQQHGIGCLELQRIAVRILSQTCSSIGCEHIWGAFDHTYTERHNLLARKTSNDLAFVHYNLRLKERQTNNTLNEAIPLHSVLLERVLDGWIVPTEKSSLQDDEGIFRVEMDRGDAYKDPVDGNDSLESRRNKIIGHAGLPEIVKPLEVHPSLLDAGVEDDEADIDFLDEEVSHQQAYATSVAIQ